MQKINQTQSTIPKTSGNKSTKSSNPNTSTTVETSKKKPRKAKLSKIHSMRVHLLECLLQNKNQNNIKL